MSQTYFIPATTLERELEVKKSRFIARATHVGTREDAMAFLDSAMQDYPDARHHCWAYLLGNPLSASTAGSNDDGEPSGTAGKPILNVIRHKDIGDVMVVVSRYFGGIKLGAGGLTRAYGNATEAVLSALPLEQHRILVHRKLRCDFSLEQPLRHWAAQHQASVIHVEYSDAVSLVLALPHESAPSLESFCQSNGIPAQGVE